MIKEMKNKVLIASDDCDIIGTVIKYVDGDLNKTIVESVSFSDGYNSRIYIDAADWKGFVEMINEIDTSLKDFGEIIYYN